MICCGLVDPCWTSNSQKLTIPNLASSETWNTLCFTGSWNRNFRLWWGSRRLERSGRSQYTRSRCLWHSDHWGFSMGCLSKTLFDSLLHRSKMQFKSRSQTYHWNWSFGSNDTNNIQQPEYLFHVKIQAYNSAQVQLVVPELFQWAFLLQQVESLWPHLAKPVQICFKRIQKDEILGPSHIL